MTVSGGKAISNYRPVTRPNFAGPRSVWTRGGRRDCVRLRARGSCAVRTHVRDDTRRECESVWFAVPRASRFWANVQNILNRHTPHRMQSAILTLYGSGGAKSLTSNKMGRFCCIRNGDS